MEGVAAQIESKKLVRTREVIQQLDLAGVEGRDREILKGRGSVVAAATWPLEVIG